VVDRVVDRALCSLTCAMCGWPGGRPLVVQSHNMSYRRSIRWFTTLAVLGQLLLDRYSLNLQVHVLRMAGRLAHCLRLRLGFYLAPLNSDLYAIFSDELKNSTNKILHSLPTIIPLGEDFSNLSWTQHSTMSIPSDCNNVVAYVPPVQRIKSSVVHPNELHRAQANWRIWSNSL